MWYFQGHVVASTWLLTTWNSQSVISTSGYMRRSKSSSLLSPFYLKLGRRMKDINKGYNYTLYSRTSLGTK